MVVVRSVVPDMTRDLIFSDFLSTQNKIRHSCPQGLLEISFMANIKAKCYVVIVESGRRLTDAREHGGHCPKEEFFG